MKIITAPEEYTIKDDDFCIFLAGGITGCPDWQKQVISELGYMLPISQKEHIVIFNPRRESFQIDNPEASKEQITWEYKYIEACNLFTMYFCKDQIQPICLYELGRAFGRRAHDRLVVTSNPKYPRLIDINIQAACVFGKPTIKIGEETDHAKNIYDQIQAMFICAESSPPSRSNYPFNRY